MRMKRVAVDLFSGLVVPMTFFPRLAESVLRFFAVPGDYVFARPGDYGSGNGRCRVSRLADPGGMVCAAVSAALLPLAKRKVASVRTGRVRDECSMQG